jgi:hypothetical protein
VSSYFLLQATNSSFFFFSHRLFNCSPLTTTPTTKHNSNYPTTHITMVKAVVAGAAGGIGQVRAPNRDAV